MAIADGQRANAANLNAAFADISFQTIAAGTKFTLVNNQVATANVTGFLLDNTACRARFFTWLVYRKSTGGGGQVRVQTGRAFCYWDDSAWHLVQQTMSPTDAGVVLDINSATGQINYVSDDNGGTYSSVTSYLVYQPEATLEL